MNYHARITDFFSNSSHGEKREDSKGTPFTEDRPKQRALVRELSENLEACMSKNAELEHVIKLKNEEIKRLVDSCEKMERRFETFRQSIKDELAEKVLLLEKYQSMETYHELMQKKTLYGQLKSSTMTKSFDDWIDGTEIIKLKEEREKLIDQFEILQNEKRGLRSTKRRSTDLVAEYKETAKQMLTNVTKRLEEIEVKLGEFNGEKFDIAFRERRINDQANCFFAKRQPETDFPAWPILAHRYQVLSLVGRGGFSEVYKAYDLESLQTVVIKLHQMSPKWDTAMRENYLKHTNRENEVYKHLNHPHIVKYFDTIDVDSLSFGTVLEYCDGPDLDYQLKRNGVFNEKAAKHIIKQIIAAVRYLNEQSPKIIHYDLKPQNILFTKHNIAKLTDFGLCKIADSDDSKMELTSQGAGTYWYLPPECFETGKAALISSKVDVWSIGVILYQMLYGKKPFGHNMSQEKIHKERIILRSTMVVFPEKPVVSNELKEFMKKCMTHDQNQRLDINAAWLVFHRLT